MVAAMPPRPTRQPRTWVRWAGSFGTEPEIEWHAARNAEGRIELQAAQVQHRCVVVMRDTRNLRGHTSWRSVADSLETLSYEQLMRLLRGEARMSLRNAIDLSRVFGPLLVLAADVRQRNELSGEWPQPPR